MKGLSSLKIPERIFSQVNNLANIFTKKTNALIVVDIGPELTLVSIELKAELQIKSIKITPLPQERKEEAILGALHDFIRENNIAHKNAVLKPLLKSVFSKRLKLPAMPRAELLDAIKWQLKEELPFDVNSAIVDFLVIKETLKDDGSKASEVICVAAAEEEIRAQVLLLKQAGLNCLNVSLLPFGYANIIAGYFAPGKNEAIGVLHIADDRAFVTIHGIDKIEYYRELPLSIDKFRDALSARLTTAKGMINLLPEDINKVLFEYGIPQGAAAGYKDIISASEVLGMLRADLERLTSEIKRSLSYYDAQYQGGAKVNKMMISGLGAKVPNLDKFLSQELNLDIQEMNLADKVEICEGVSARDLSESAADVGLALGYESGINLLPYEFRTEKIERFQKLSLRWIALAAFLILAVSYIFAKAGVGMQERRLKNALLQLNVLSEVRSIKARLDVLNNFTGEINSLYPPVEPILKKISNIATRQIFFNELSLDFSTKSGFITGVFKGDDDTVLTAFVNAFNQSGYVMNAAIDDMEKSGTGVTNFRVAFKFP